MLKVSQILTYITETPWLGSLSIVHYFRLFIFVLQYGVAAGWNMQRERERERERECFEQKYVNSTVTLVIELKHM
jgi:hypothetical protein